MIHDFDMARFLLGDEPVAISAMGSALVDSAIGDAGDIDTAVVIMETKSGKVAQISNWFRSPRGIPGHRRSRISRARAVSFAT
jgi:myo-inositol 2-dehydrogenase/D-chiro-inositol 1-dehydrogenase